MYGCPKTLLRERVPSSLPRNAISWVTALDADVHGNQLLLSISSTRCNVPGDRSQTCRGHPQRIQLRSSRSPIPGTIRFGRFSPPMWWIADLVRVLESGRGGYPLHRPIPSDLAFQMWGPGGGVPGGIGRYGYAITATGHLCRQQPGYLRVIGRIWLFRRNT